MRKNTLKEKLCLIVFLLMFLNILGIQQVYAAGTGEQMMQELYKSNEYRLLSKLSNVSIDKFFTVRFSQDINYKTVDNNSIVLIEKESGNKMNLTFEQIDDKSVKATPQQLLVKGKDYYLVVHKSIKTKDNLIELFKGTITEVSVNDAYSSFMVESASLIYPDKVEIKFNEVVNYTKGSTKQYYKINGIYPTKVEVLKDGKTAVLTLDASNDHTGQELKVFISNNITNSFGKYLVNDYEIKLNGYSSGGSNGGNTGGSTVPGPIDPNKIYFNILPEKLHASTSDDVQRFEILIQAIGGTFKEDLSGTNYDKAFRVVSIPTGFGIGTRSDGSPDITAVKRISPSMLKIRIDGRFPILKNENIILEFSQDALNENNKGGENIIEGNEILKIEIVTN